MAYTTTALTNDVLGPHASTTTTTPTTVELSAIIDGIASQVDTVLSGAGVATVPVTNDQNSTFFTFLAEVNKWGAAGEFLTAMFPEAGESTAFGFWQKKYDDTLKAWRDGKDIPSSLLGGSNDASPSSYFTRNPDTEETLGDLSQNADRTRMESRF
jgi:hypothetical protein